MTKSLTKLFAALLAGMCTLPATELVAQSPPASLQPAGQSQSAARPGQTEQTPGGTTSETGSGQTVEEVADTPFFGEGSEVPEEDTIKKRRPKKPLESYFFADSVRGRQNMRWTVDPYRNHIEIGHIDTLQKDFQIQYPFMKKRVGSAYLGNLGAPSEYLSYFDREQGRYHTFSDPWGAYLRSMETMPFYNVKMPFTQLSYEMAGQKAQQEEDFIAIHAQNISPQTGFNIDYRSLGTKGIYQWQSTRDKTLSIGISHTGKRYTAHAGYIHNSVYNRENGGIVDDDMIIVDELYNTYDQTNVVPMLMSDPKNRIKSNSFFLIQSYGVPLRRVTEEDFTIADRPAFFLGHAIEYNRWVRKYQDSYGGTVYKSPQSNEPQRPYYDNWFYNPGGSADSLFESRLSNRVFLQLQPWDRSGIVGTIDAGVGVDMMQYYNFSPDHYLTGVKGHNIKETEYYAYGGIDGRINRYFDWSAYARLHPFGARGGDTELRGEAAARLFIKGRPLSVSGRFGFTSMEPSHWEQNFSSNHYMWSNSFSKENETRIDISLSVPHIGLEATVSQSILGNKVYYGADKRPVQASDAVSVTGVYLREDLPIRIGSSSINLNHRVMLQWSTDQRVVPVPLASAYLTYFYEFNVVRNVLRLQIGLEGRYNTRYYASGYDPGTGQFYNQREKQLGEYVWMDVFVNAKWKRMRILLKVQHLNDDMFGVRNYFSVLHYPMNRRILKLGISWNFYD